MVRRILGLLTSLALAATALVTVVPPAAGDALVRVEIAPSDCSGLTSLDPTATPPCDTPKTATQAGQYVGVSGSAPPGVPITSARWVTTYADGTTADTILSGALNRGPAGPLSSGRQDYLRNNSGTLEGELTAPGAAGRPLPGDPLPILLQLVVEVGLTAGESEPLLVDLDRPVVAGYELVAPNRIRIVFSEPVFRPGLLGLPIGEDQPLDWQVQDPDRTVLAVRGATPGDCLDREGVDASNADTGCTRTLVLDRSLDEDAAPGVRYCLSCLSVQEIYADLAGNAVDLTKPSDTTRLRTVTNLIRPAIPTIAGIDGKAPAGEGPRVASTARDPEIRVRNLRPGQLLFFAVERPDGSTFETADDPVEITAEEMAVRLPEALVAEAALPGIGDGSYRLEAVVRDVHGNRSDDADKEPGRDDGGPSAVTYALDTVAPRVLSAEAIDVREVLVRLSEDVAPDDAAGVWRVDGTPAEARGEGDVRRLTVASDLNRDDHALSWAPEGSTYADEAGNALRPVDELPIGELVPVPVPVVTLPDVEVYLPDAEVRVEGTAPAGAAVEISESDDPEAVLVSTTADGQGAWVVTVPLPADGRYRLEARIRHAETGVRGAAASVPDVIRDTVAPAVEVHEPAGPGLLDDLLDPVLSPVLGLLPVSLPGLGHEEPRYAVGDPVQVEWTAADDASTRGRGDSVRPDHGERVDVEIRFADGQTRRIGPEEPEDAYVAGQRTGFTYTIEPEDLGDLPARAASFRVSATDLAGNVGDGRSGTIQILTGLIGYTPVLLRNSSLTQTAIIDVRFPEALQGQTTLLDWEVRDGNCVDGPRRPVLATSTTTDDRDRTVVRLRVADITDPNATPCVAYAERFGRLRGLDGVREVSPVPREAIDGIAPVLEIQRPDPGPSNTEAVTITGTTDRTSRPNLVEVYALDEAGQRSGEPVAVTQAGGDGRFSVRVPLERNRHNELLVEAVDRAFNRSPGELVRVVEDSLAPVVRVTSPSAGAALPRQVRLRWVTDDVHPALADVEVLINGQRRVIATEISDDGRLDWDVDGDIGADDTLEFVVRATDAAGNVGEGRRGGLSLRGPVAAPTPPVGGPPLTDPVFTAIATGERTIEVTFPRSVEVARGAAGFSIAGGPGVERIGGTGATRTLVLNTDLHTTTPTVVYTGRGVSYTDGTAVEAARVRAARGFAFPPSGLGGDSRNGRARLSWTDERNTVGDVVRYEILRDGSPLGEVAGAARAFADDRAGRGARTYGVRTIDDLGHVSRTVTVRLDPDAPNITPRGGFVLSDDGQVALIVPPGAVRKDHHGRFDALGAVRPAGYRPVTDGYRLVVEAADDRSERLEAFERFSCVSFRPGADALSDREAARVMGLRLDGGGERLEMATRAGRASAESCLLSVGDVALGEAAGATTRAVNADPAIYGDRFATAVALSQSSFDAAGTVVLARADDYPDALAASALAAQVGGPVLLSTTEQMPEVTVLELRRLGAERVVLAGGAAALSEGVARQAAELGFAVERVAGPTRYETAAEIARRTGAFDGRAFLATGQQFADALAASAPSSLLTRPILLTATADLPPASLDALRRAGVRHLTLLGGSAAISPGVEARLQDEGFTVDRIAGPTRFETAVGLADALAPEGLLPARPIAATGQGDGRTSPDALAAGPVAGRFGAPLLLVPRDNLGSTVEGTLRRATGVRGVVVAGGAAAVSDRTRAEIDAATR
jgi:putative cell wall-binding protein